MIEILTEAHIETATSRYNNRILEISFDKNKQTKPKGNKDRLEARPFLYI